MYIQYIMQCNHQTIHQDGVDVFGNHNTIFGNGCNITGNNNCILGNRCNIIGNNNTVKGSGCNVAGRNNTVTGIGCNVTGEGSTSAYERLGAESSFTHSAAIGVIGNVTGNGNVITANSDARADSISMHKAATRPEIQKIPGGIRFNASRVAALAGNTIVADGWKMKFTGKVVGVSATSNQSIVRSYDEDAIDKFIEKYSDMNTSRDK